VRRGIPHVCGRRCFVNQVLRCALLLLCPVLIGLTCSCWCTAACHAFTSETSVASCTTCTGPNIADCTAGKCADGYHTFVDGDASSTKCSGARFVALASSVSSGGLTCSCWCTAACHAFTSEASVASCTTCTGPNIADCTAGKCADGYHTFVDGDASSTKCSGACTTEQAQSIFSILAQRLRIGISHSTLTAVLR
jgi:hypothetical protein